MIIFRVEHNRLRLQRMQVHVCENRLERGRGMLLRRTPDFQTAYLLPRCRAIHTIGMHHAIDVLFCDARGRIVSIREGLRPCRVARDGKAHHVWEMRAGCVRLHGWRVGDWIRPC